MFGQIVHLFPNFFFPLEYFKANLIHITLPQNSYEDLLFSLEYSKTTYYAALSDDYFSCNRVTVP